MEKWRSRYRAVARTISFLLGRIKTPDWLYLEFVNTCNADCVFCAYRFDPREKTTMPMSTVMAAADEFHAKGGKNIGLSPLLGETFVDRDAVAKIEYLKSKNFDWMHTYTNASLLHRAGFNKVLRSGLTNLRLSLPPMSEETYVAIFRNKNYRRVLSNVCELLKAFRDDTEKTVKEIHIEFRADRPLEACLDMPDYKTQIAPLISEGVYVHSLSQYDAWSGAIKPSDMLPGMELLDGSAKGSKRSPCARMFHLQVLSDGKIRQCGCRVDSFSEQDELIIGDISKISLEDAYTSTKAKSNIASFITGRHLDVCKSCSWYEPI